MGNYFLKSSSSPQRGRSNSQPSAIINKPVKQHRKSVDIQLCPNNDITAREHSFIPISEPKSPSQNGHVVNKSNGGSPMDEAPSNFYPCNQSDEVERFIALHNYTARVDDDLSLVKGQLYIILDRSQGSWWYAESVSTGQKGYVPYNYLAPDCSLESNEWYFGEIKRLEAEQHLKRPDVEQGCFLVRVSESRNAEYSLSVRDHDSVKHYRIRSRASRTRPGITWYFISRECSFNSIAALIAHYKNTANGLCCKLIEPCRKLVHPEPIGLAHTVIDKWEIPKSSIELMERIGQGQFGEVYRGLWNNTTEVAVKTLKIDCFNTADFLQEARTMQRLHHTHLIQLYAVCTQSEPFYIITELMPHGALLNFLQSSEGRRLQLHDLVVMSTQIASGMHYLEISSFIHRDLAARNILVGENNIVKIADFGLARMICDREYMAHAGARFPIKWTAPEAANYYRFTIKSDVWSFGILLTEIVTYGRVPYPGMNNVEVLQKIENGYRMPPPPGCPPELYDLMVDCWNADEDQRPSFQEILNRLTEYRDEERGSYRDVSENRDDFNFSLSP